MEGTGIDFRDAVAGTYDAPSINLVGTGSYKDCVGGSRSATLGLSWDDDDIDEGSIVALIGSETSSSARPDEDAGDSSALPLLETLANDPLDTEESDESDLNGVGRGEYGPGSTELMSSTSGNTDLDSSLT